MRRKIIPSSCRKCIARRKRNEAQKWEEALKPFVRIPAPPKVITKKPFFLFRIFNLGGKKC